MQFEGHIICIVSLVVWSRRAPQMGWYMVAMYATRWIHYRMRVFGARSECTPSTAIGGRRWCKRGQTTIEKKTPFLSWYSWYRQLFSFFFSLFEYKFCAFGEMYRRHGICTLEAVFSASIYIRTGVEFQPRIECNKNWHPNWPNLLINYAIFLMIDLLYAILQYCLGVALLAAIKGLIPNPCLRPIKNLFNVYFQ